MKRWAGWVLRHRALVAGFWLVIAVAGAVLVPTTVGRLTYEFALLAPVLVGVLGPLNWSLPGPLGTVLGIRRGNRA